MYCYCFNTFIYHCDCHCRYLSDWNCVRMLLFRDCVFVWTFVGCYIWLKSRSVLAWPWSPCWTAPKEKNINYVHVDATFSLYEFLSKVLLLIFITKVSEIREVLQYECLIFNLYGALFPRFCSNLLLSLNSVHLLNSVLLLHWQIVWTVSVSVYVIFFWKMLFIQKK